jgi:hypothetical protein
MPRARVARLLAIGYVLVVAASALQAFVAPNDQSTWRSFLPELLTVPAIVPLLPAVYLVLALTWIATGADAGGPAWVVTVVCTLLFAGVAAANVWLATQGLALVRRCRHRALRLP